MSFDLSDSLISPNINNEMEKKENHHSEKSPLDLNLDSFIPANERQYIVELKEKIKIVNLNNTLAERQKLCTSYAKLIEQFNHVFPYLQINDDLADLGSEHANYQQALRKEAEGANPKQLQALLVKAIEDEQPEAAFWLIGKGARLPNEVSPKHEGLLNWLKKASDPTIKAIPENLNYLAREVGYGYKAASLLINEEEARSLELSSCIVKVPPFVPISDYEMQNYLFKSCPEILIKWQRFIQTFDRGVRKAFLNQNPNQAQTVRPKISREGEEILLEIQEIIRNQFASESYFSLRIEEWLRKENPELVIVRSTGNEDEEEDVLTIGENGGVSAAKPNAGGNDSVPFVKPNSEAISKALATVIISYFGERSISQRLENGDISVFLGGVPLIPALVQTMVLESDSNQVKNILDIPRSGVMFTRQPNKAKGVTFFQAGFGNNSGVVSSQVAVDSYFVDDKNHVEVVNRNKKTRVVSDSQGNSIVVSNKDIHCANGEDPCHVQALPNRIAQDVRKMGAHISKNRSKGLNFLKPLDMEFSVKLREKNSDKPVIYLLQTRSIRTSTQPIKPSYINIQTLAQQKNFESRSKHRVIVDTKNEVQQVTGSDEILFSGSLSEALKLYKKTADSHKIKVVVVRRSALDLSHEAVEFSGLGVTVILLDQETYHQMKKFTYDASSDHPIMVDTQRGLIFRTKGIQNPEGLINEGYVSYPIPREVSIPKNLYWKAGVTFIEKDYQNLQKSLIAEGEALYPTQGQNAKKLEDLLDIMACDSSKDSKDAKRALATILALIHDKWHYYLKNPTAITPLYLEQLYHLFSYVIKLSKRQIIPALNEQAPQTLERLYYIKFLEAAIFQQPPDDVVDGFSFAAFLRANKVCQEVSKEAQLKIADSQDLFLIPLLTHGQEAAISLEAARKWNEFVAELQARGGSETTTALYRLVEKMRSLNVFSSWLNIMFAPSWQPGTAENVFANAKKEMLSDENLACLEWVAANREKIPKNEELEFWNNPTFAQNRLSSLKKLFSESFGYGSEKKSLAERYAKSGKLAQLAMVSFVRGSTNAYDLIMKQITESQEFSNKLQLKAELVVDLIEGLDEIQETAMALVDPKDAYALVGREVPKKIDHDAFYVYLTKLREGGKYHTDTMTSYSFSGFLNLSRQVREKAMNEQQLNEQFEAGLEFNVSAIVLGSLTGSSCIIPPTRLVHHHTLRHQNIILLSDYIAMKLGLNEDILSGQPAEISSLVATKFARPISAINQRSSNTTIVYQVPLREHAATISIDYKPGEPNSGLDINVQLFGMNLGERWYQTTLHAAYMVNAIEGLNFTDGIVPQVEWNQSANEKYLIESNANFVEFSLHIPEHFSISKQLVDMLHHVIVDVSLKDHVQSNETNLIKCQSMAPMADFDQIKNDFFSSTFWGLDLMLSKIRDKNKLHEALKRIVVHACDKQINCDNFKLNRYGDESLYNLIEMYMMKLFHKSTAEFITLIDELHPIISKSNSNKKLAMFIEKYMYLSDLEKLPFSEIYKIYEGIEAEEERSKTVSPEKAYIESKISIAAFFDHALEKKDFYFAAILAGKCNKIEALKKQLFELRIEELSVLYKGTNQSEIRIIKMREYIKKMNKTIIHNIYNYLLTLDRNRAMSFIAACDEMYNYFKDFTSEEILDSI